MLEQSLGIFEAEHGKESVGAARVMQSLGLAKASIRQTKAAVDLLRRAYTIFEREFGVSHPQVRTIESALTGLTRSVADHQANKKARVRGDC